MTRGRFYATAMPVWAILYVIGLMAFDGGKFAAIGAMGFALIAVVGIAIPAGDPNDARPRSERRADRPIRRT